MEYTITMYRKTKKTLDMLKRNFNLKSEECSYQKLVEGTDFDSMVWYTCTNKNHMYFNAMVTKCGLEHCPLYREENDND